MRLEYILAARSTETLQTIYQNVWRYILEDRTLQKNVTRFVCLTVRLLFLSTFHLDF